jgi:hypothetical protein
LPGYFSNGVFMLELSGLPGQSFVIQSSTNLVDWVPVLTNTPDTSPFYETVPRATNSWSTFYRAVVQP